MQDTWEELTTPCYIFDAVEFQKGICQFRSALEKKFANVVIGYSVKTNWLPYAMSQAHRFGCKAEVVSHDEYMLARTVGFLPSEIIYNGPMKSRKTFIEAVTGGAIVNIETKRELDWLNDLPAGRPFKVGLRLNINISDISSDDADGDNDNSRFGFSEDSGEFRQAVDFIKSLPDVYLAGLHIHRTAHSRSPRFYSRSVDFACRVIRKYGLNLDYLDIGGGYFGIFPNKPTFDDYADAIHASLSRYGLTGLSIIVEPGNALTASSFCFLSEVIDVKMVDRGVRFVTTDGSRNDIDPFFHKTDYLKEIFYADDNRPVDPVQIVAGCTCLEYDRLFTLNNAPRLEVGDRIKYNNVGAYTMCLSPLFIRLFPRVYALRPDGDCEEVRALWNVEKLL